MNTLFSLRFKRIKGFIKKEIRGRLLIYFIVIFIFLSGTYWVFLRVFSFLNNIEEIGEIIAGKIISYSFFVFFFMLLISNGITALSTFYRSKEVEFLMALPVPPANIFISKIFETFFFSSWATLIGAVPIVLAYFIAYGSPWGIVYTIPSFMGFIAIPSFLGIIVLMVLKRINPNLSVKQLGITLGIISGIIIYLYILTNPYSFNIPQTTNLYTVNRFLDRLRFSNPYFPNEWLFNVVRGIVDGRMFQFFRYTGSLLLVSFSLFLILYFLGVNWYRETWLTTEHSKKIPHIRLRFFLKRPSQLVNLLSKDWRIFIRSPNQWVQFLIIFLLLLFYVISLRRTPVYVKEVFWLTITALINTGFVAYISATLSLRFIFPAISLEGDYWWILRSAPVKPRNIYITKMIFYIALTTVISIYVIYTSNIRLTGSLIITLVTVIIGTMLTITSVILATTMGTIFVDFNEHNPAKIASGMGGLLTAVLSLGFIGLSLIIFLSPFSHYLGLLLKGISVNPWPIMRNRLILFIVISTLLDTWLVKIGVSRIGSIEG